MKKINRNDLCQCGSGKKYKKCCLNLESGPSKSFKMGSFIVLVVLGIIVVGSSYDFLVKNQKETKPFSGGRVSHKTKELPLDNIFLKPAEIEKYDLATLNLIAAQGLPNAENINFSEIQSTLKHWAAMVDSETKKYMVRFYQHPEEYNHSEAYFRVLMLITVLEQDLKVRYNPDLMSGPVYSDLQSARFFKDPNDLFLPGLIKNRLGTCASLPVLTAAVGRLLGYPLKLVPTKAHLFVRWDDGTERFNIESGGNGMKNYPDDHYKKWPFPISDSELQNGYYLKSLTPVQEYAAFLEMRGFCFLANNRLNDAFNAFTQVSRLHPDHPHVRMYLESVLQMEMNQEDQ